MGTKKDRAHSHPAHVIQVSTHKKVIDQLATAMGEHLQVNMATIRASIQQACIAPAGTPLRTKPQIQRALVQAVIRTLAHTETDKPEETTEFSKLPAGIQALVDEVKHKLHLPYHNAMQGLLDPNLGIGDATQLEALDRLRVTNWQQLTQEVAQDPIILTAKRYLGGDILASTYLVRPMPRWVYQVLAEYHDIHLLFQQYETHSSAHYTVARRDTVKTQFTRRMSEVARRLTSIMQTPSLKDPQNAEQAIRNTLEQLKNMLLAELQAQGISLDEKVAIVDFRSKRKAEDCISRTKATLESDFPARTKEFLDSMQAIVDEIETHYLKLTNTYKKLANLPDEQEKVLATLIEQVYKEEQAARREIKASVRRIQAPFKKAGFHTRAFQPGRAANDG